MGHAHFRCKVRLKIRMWKALKCLDIVQILFRIKQKRRDIPTYSRLRNLSMNSDMYALVGRVFNENITPTRMYTDGISKTNQKNSTMQDRDSENFLLNFAFNSRVLRFEINNDYLIDPSIDCECRNKLG